MPRAEDPATMRAVDTVDLRRSPAGEEPERRDRDSQHETCNRSWAATSAVAFVRRRSGDSRTIGLPPPDWCGMTGADSARRVETERHDQLLTVAQAGDYLGTGERFIRRLIAQRRITYVKLGKYVRLQRSALDAFVAAGQVTSEQ
jgi:excisionase family DNA binding protein